MTDICEPARTGCSQLLATSDGGATWTNATPAKARGLSAAPPPTANPKPRSALRIPRPRTQASHPTGPEPLYVSVGTRTHVAFDSYNVLYGNPTTPCKIHQAVGYMQAWWNYSPYWDVVVYLPGAPNGHLDQCLSPQWITQVMQQGWGFVPTWVGDQSACACHGNPCVPYNNQISAMLRRELPSRIQRWCYPSK